MTSVQVLEDLVYEKTTGQAGTLDLYVPKETEGVFFLYFHGGGLESGDKRDDRGVLKELAANGIIVASANYRMYPEAKYPQYLLDAAGAVSWSMAHVREFAAYEKMFVGGVSAGAYLAMMLHFCPDILLKQGVDESRIAGYLFDAGQPTVHFRVLRERGMDPTCVRVDEAAPLFYLCGKRLPNEKQSFLILTAERDIPGRREQNELLIRTMESHGYAKEQITYHVMEGFGHAEYVYRQDPDGSYPYAGLLLSFLKK